MARIDREDRLIRSVKLHNLNNKRKCQNPFSGVLNTVGQHPRVLSQIHRSGLLVRANGRNHQGLQKFSILAPAGKTIAELTVGSR